MKVPCTLPALWRCDMLSSLASVITTPPSPTRCLLVTFGDDCSLFSIWMNMIVFMYFQNHNGGDDHDHHGGDCADDNNDQGDDDDDDDDDDGDDDDDEHDDDDDDDHDDDDDDNANLWSLYTQHAYTKSCPPERERYQPLADHRPRSAKCESAVRKMSTNIDPQQLPIIGIKFTVLQIPVSGNLLHDYFWTFAEALWYVADLTMHDEVYNQARQDWISWRLLGHSKHEKV